MVECTGICMMWPGSVARAMYMDVSTRRYAFCKICNRSFPVEDLKTCDTLGRLICPCCKRVLRQTPRKPKSKVKMLMRFDRIQAELYLGK